MERALRNLVLRSPLANSSILAKVYQGINRRRFSGMEATPIAFRGAEFVIGADPTLLPLVHSGAFEDRELDWLLPRIAPDALVWDVGANVGIYTVLMARAAERGQLVAFEPSPVPLTLLRENLARNDVNGVVVVEAGVSDRAGAAVLHARTDTAGGSSLEHAADGSVPTEITLVCGDDLVREGFAAPTVIKIDVEGHEPQVIAGCKNLIHTGRPTIILEVNAGTYLGDPARTAAWGDMITWLLSEYGSATWFGPRGVTQVEELDHESLPVARPYSLAFGG